MTQKLWFFRSSF